MDDITARLGQHQPLGGLLLREGDKVSMLYLLGYTARPSSQFLDTLNILARRENPGDHGTTINVQPFPFSDDIAKGMAHQNMDGAEAYYLVAITTKIQGWERGLPHARSGMPKDQWLPLLSANADALMARFYAASEKAPQTIGGVGYCRLDPAVPQGKNTTAH